MKFNVTYASGVVETVVAELEHAEALANQMFGHTLAEVEALGAKIEAVVEDSTEPAAPEPAVEEEAGNLTPAAAGQASENDPPAAADPAAAPTHEEE